MCIGSLYFAFTITIFLYMNGANGHLCLITPHQRGALDIHDSGSSTCFRHGSPCGGQLPEKPIVEYTGGQQMWIKIQQNFNHYEVGFPGYMDISIAPLLSLDFTVLAYTPDVYVHAQDHQQNFTTIVVLPNIDCEHCVIRARYDAHKPGEDIFYQCADIKIKKSNTLDASTRDRAALYQNQDTPLDPVYLTVNKKVNILRQQSKYVAKETSSYLIGLSYTPFRKDYVDLVNVSLTTGYPDIIGGYLLPVALSNENPALHRKASQPKRKVRGVNEYIYDSIGAINYRGNLVGFYHSGNPDVVDDGLMEYDLDRQGRDLSIIGVKYAKVPINALLSHKNGSYYTFTIKDGDMKGYYAFEIGQLVFYEVPGSYDPHYLYSTVFVSKSENLYINYQWAEFDSERNLIYVLMGNENSPDELQARIYTFNLTSKSVTYAEMDVSSFTFMAFHLDRRSGKLFVVSPGLFQHTSPAWVLLEIDPSTGNSEVVFKIAEAGFFAPVYGGNIFNAISPEGILYHVFKLSDTNADVIAAIDISKKTVTFSDITNLGSMHDLALVNPN